MKLRRWHRVGIVASIGWILYAGFSERVRHVDQAYLMGRIEYVGCMNVDKRSSDECREVHRGVVKEFLATHVWLDWISFIVVAVLPVILAWLLAGLGLWVYRWIVSGDR